MVLDPKRMAAMLPESPGVYLMKDAGKKILYIGKAANLRRRVASYFERPHDARIEDMVGRIATVAHRKTDTALEALILEAKLIKAHQPPYNVREKDDKSFLFVEITKEKFPRVILVRGRNKTRGRRFGPFISAASIRDGLRLLRRMFPFSMHDPRKTFSRPCFDYEVGLCPGTCIGAVTAREYAKNIRGLVLFFEGKKKAVAERLEREMRSAAAREAFEEADILKKRLFALRHIQDIAFIRDDVVESGSAAFRIEGYDISNISGSAAVGACVVFERGMMRPSEYRTFHIRAVSGQDDVAMLKETVRRRFRHPEWRFPDLLLVDGGMAQVNGVRFALRSLGIARPVVGIAKGPTRKKNDIIGNIPRGVSLANLIAVRDEAHRFAVRAHTRLRSRRFLPSSRGSVL